MPLPAAAAGIVSMAMAYVIGRIIFKVIAGLGIGVIAFVGFDALLDEAQAYINDTLFQLPAQVSQLLAICNVDDAINLLLAAYVARFTIVPIFKKLTFGNTG